MHRYPTLVRSIDPWTTTPSTLIHSSLTPLRTDPCLPRTYPLVDPTDSSYACNSYSFDWETESVFNGNAVPSRHSMTHVGRSFLSKIFATVLLIVNWLLTAGCVHITSVSVVAHRELGEGMLFLCINITLTIPVSRQLCVGSPPFDMSLRGCIVCLYCVLP